MLHAMLGDADRAVVIDVETTCLFGSDRVVEVAAVTVDRRGRIVDEWDTLVDPQRDVGPTHIHGLTATMVSAAPRFEDIAKALGDRVDGAALVAYNLAFDARMLTNEFERLDARFAPGSGVCTLRLGGGKLTDVCRMYGVELLSAHRALGDARATARMLAPLAGQIDEPCSPAHVYDVATPYNARTLQREMVDGGEVPMPYLARLTSSVHHRGEHGVALAYLDLLDWALADLAISETERHQLDQLAADLGLSPDEVAAAHRRYVDELVAAAVRDEIVTDEEQALLHRAADALGVDPAVVDAGTKVWRQDAGGVAQGLLVAADVSSQSGKAGKARRYGIPLVEVHDFLRARPGSTVPAVVT